MAAHATLKYALTSDKKLLLVAKLVKGKNVEDALTDLEFTNKKAAGILAKVIKSAFANAKQDNPALTPREAMLDQIYVSRGPKIKRARFVSRGRVHPYIKHRAFVKVVLNA
jgi:ribosomal protein L22, bacterial type